MAKVLITYEAEASSLKATVAEVNKANDDVVKEAQDSSKKVADAYKNAGKSIAAAFAGTQVKKALNDQNKAFEDLNKKTVPLTRVLRNLRNELNQLEEEGKAGTEQFKKLIIEAARLEDQIGDTRARVANLAADTFKFDAAVEAVQGLAAGFEIAQGAAALFGDESEDLQRALLKVQAATAVANGVQQIANLLLEESKVKTLALSAAQRVYSFVTEASTAKTKAFRLALVSTGVGALVVALGFLIEKFIGAGDAAKEAADDTNEYQKAIDSLNTSATKALTGAANAQLRLLVRQNKLTEEAAARLIAFNNLQTELTDLNVETKEKEAEAFRRFEEQKAKDIEQFGRVSKITEQQLSKDLATIQQQRAATERDIRAKAQLEILEINDQAEKKRIEAAKKRAEEEAKIEKEKRDSLNRLRTETAEAQLELERRINEQLKAEQKKLEVELTSLSDTSIQTQLETRIAFLKRLELEEGTSIERRINILELEAKARQATIRDTVDDVAKANQLILLDQTETQKRIGELRRANQQQQIEEAFQVAQQIAGIFNQLSQLSSQLTENRIAGINEASQAELAAIDNSTKTERQKQREREALELRTSRRIAQEKIKQAKLDKATALFGAVISTAESIVKTGANLGYPAAIPFQVLAGILGAAQIATIAARPIPKFAKGGEVGGRLHSQGGTLIEAERGEFVTNRRQTARHRQELDAINTSTAAFQKLINERYVRPAIQSFMLSGRDKSLTVNASLNSKSMEREIKAMRKSMRKPVVINLSSSDQRYTWQ